MPRFNVAARLPAALLGAVLALFVFIVLSAALLPASASAQPYGRGYAPPSGYEKILEDRLFLYPEDKNNLPIFWDWRNNDGVTPVKNQGSCGSCWAFAATAEMESKIKIYYQRTVDLSEQQIISCNPYGAGCDGGWAAASYYVHMHHGGILEHCMPYEGSDFVPCTQDDYLKFTNISNWVHISNNVTQIKNAVYNNGPVSTAVDANDAWDGYTSGVITAPGSGTNHLVLIVGWDDRLGDGGAWIVKNSWGAGWGMNGYCYVAYGACNIGAGTTSLTYAAPPVRVTVASPVADGVYYADDLLTVQWATFNQPVNHVDLWYGTAGSCQNQPIALGVPNTGSYDWTVPNQTTQRGTVLVYPSEGTHRGFGFTAGEFRIVGKQTRYVSAAGSNTPPYDTPAKAAHSIAAAVLAGAGRDSVLVAAGNYLESPIAVNTQCYIVGGWNAAFTVCDPELYPTRLRSVNGAVRFAGGAGSHCGVSNIIFHDCQGSFGQVPVQGRHGAAIISIGTSPQIVNCRFENNRAEAGVGVGWGGAILSHGGSPLIRDCTFVGNIGSHGAAVAFSSCVDARVEDSLFLANATSDSTASYPGGAIYVHGGQVTISGSQLRGGGAGIGGAVAVAGGGVLRGHDLEVAGNRAGHGGGGVHAAGGTLELVRSHVVGNRTWNGSGGGVTATATQLALSNVLLSGNIATTFGGGLYAPDAVGGHVRHTVAHGNEALFGGGLHVTATVPCEVVDNVATANPGGGLFLNGAGLAASHNLAHANPGGDFIMGVGPHDLVADPCFVDPAGGDFAPGMHSPLIDSGHGAAGADWDGSETDRGLHGGQLALAAGPAAVATLAGVLVGDTVHLDWPPVDGAAMYVVYRDTAAVFVAAAELVCGSLAAPLAQFQDTPPAGDWYYVVAAIDEDGRAGGFSPRYEVAGGQQTSVEGPTVPQALAITAVAPNPFNPATTIAFDVPRAGSVSVQVFDLRGRVVATLHEGRLEAGRHAVVWRGADHAGRQVATGVYFVRLHDGQQSRTAKAVLTK